MYLMYTHTYVCVVYKVSIINLIELFNACPSPVNNIDLKLSYIYFYVYTNILK